MEVHFAVNHAAGLNVADLGRTGWSTYCTILRKFAIMIVIPHDNVEVFP